MDKNAVANSSTSLKEMLSELTQIAHGLDPWYDLGKISWYAVYVYEKSNESEHTYSNNLFDIFDDGISYYYDAYVIPREAMRIVLNIQDQMKKINNYILLWPFQNSLLVKELNTDAMNNIIDASTRLSTLKLDIKPLVRESLIKMGDSIDILK